MFWFCVVCAVWSTVCLVCILCWKAVLDRRDKRRPIVGPTTITLIQAKHTTDPMPYVLGGPHRTDCGRTFEVRGRLLPEGAEEMGIEAILEYPDGHVEVYWQGG